MLKLRKGPVCEGALADGRPCGARVSRLGERCRRCLEREATSGGVEARRQLARDPCLPPSVFELLGADPDDHVRLLVARREDCPLVVLEGLEHDQHPGVRMAAAAALSTALMPRLLQEPEDDDGHLFTQADLDALGSPRLVTDRPARHLDDDPPAPLAGYRVSLADDPRPVAGFPPPIVGWPAPPPAAPRARGDAPDGDDGLEEVLGRLEGISARLGALHATLAATGDRLGALRARLDDLGPSPEPERARALGSLLPVVHPAELGTGPVIRADIVAAAWLAVLPVLARARARQRLAPGGAVAVAGPFSGGAGAAVAELLPGPPAPTRRDLWRRRHIVPSHRRAARL